MDLGVVLHRSFHLAGLLPSTSPPPLGERTKQSSQTNSHFDSHTMSGHELEIPEILDLPHPIWEDEPSSTYGTPLGFDHSIGGTSPGDPS